MAGPIVDFYGIDFEAEFLLFGDEFEELPGIYVVYTEKSCLDMGATENLKTAIEEHQNTREWLKLAGKNDIYIAFHLDKDSESREDKIAHLKKKMKPLL